MKTVLFICVFTLVNFIRVGTELNHNCSFQENHFCSYNNCLEKYRDGKGNPSTKLIKDTTGVINKTAGLVIKSDGSVGLHGIQSVVPIFTLVILPRIML